MQRARPGRSVAAMRLAAWIDRNLGVQGYCLSAPERRRLWLGLRFATGLCLPLVALALVLESPAMLIALSGAGLIAGLSPRHPFDLLWNHAARHAFSAPPVPPSPARRRHAFKVGTAWLLAIAGLYALGAEVAALALGGVLLAACTSATVLNFCVPSYLMWLYARAHPANK
jgi:hypothetical protein